MRLVTLIAACVLSGCSKSPSSNELESSHLAEPASHLTEPAAHALDLIPGKYNPTEKYWESTDPHYKTAPTSDPAYSQLSQVDAEGKTIGFGLISKDGKVRVQPIYDAMVVGFVDGVMKVGKKDKWGWVDQQGKEIVAPQYDDIQETPAVEGLRAVRKAKLNGFIDLSGKVVIPLQYASTEIAGEGMIAVMNEPQKWGYINMQNQLIIPYLFGSPQPFKNGKAVQLQKEDGEYTAYTNGRLVQTKKW